MNELDLSALGVFVELVRDWSELDVLEVRPMVEFLKSTAEDRLIDLETGGGHVLTYVSAELSSRQELVVYMNGTPASLTSVRALARTLVGDRLIPPPPPTVEVYISANVTPDCYGAACNDCVTGCMLEHTVCCRDWEESLAFLISTIRSKRENNKRLEKRTRDE